MEPKQKKNYEELFTKSKKLINIMTKKQEKLESSLKSAQDKLTSFQLSPNVKYEIIFSFSFENSLFYLFKAENQVKLLSLDNLEEEIKAKINSDSITNYDYKRDLLSRDDTITQIVSQYEKRIQSLRNENESTEAKLADSKAEIAKFESKLNEIKAEQAHKMDELNKEFMKVLQESNEFTIKLSNLAEIEQDDLKISILRDISTEIKEFSASDSFRKFIWCEQLREIMKNTFEKWILDLHKSLKQEEKQQEIEEKHKSTLEQLMINKQEDSKTWENKVEKLKKDKLDIENQIDNERREFREKVKQLEDQVSSLSKEANKGLNLSFLRNVLVSYLSTDDKSVRKKILPVICTSLAFSEDEVNKIKEYEANRGLAGWFK